MKEKILLSAPYIVAVLLFLAIAMIYCSPLLEGKRIEQSDMRQYQGAAKEITDFREAYQEEALWTNSMFSGMPTYLISIIYKSNLFRYVNMVVTMGLHKPAVYIFVALLSFFIMLLCFKVNPWLSMAGAIAFTFSSYFFVIGAVGHNTKFLAIGYMPAIIGGVHLCFRKKYLLGAALAGIFFALQLVANHLQISYYTFLIVLVMGIFELVKAVREKLYLQFLKTVGILVLTCTLALSTNITNLWLIWEYGEESMRGKSELADKQDNKTSGLDKDYATGWSYGIGETMTLLVPNYNGSSSHHDLGTGSATYKLLKQNQVPNPNQTIKQMPAYWGTQPFTSGPVYVGAIICFLFVLGLFIVKGRLKWWLFSVTILAILLSWGKNFMFLTEFFLDYFPGYNKFRTVSMILVIAEFAMPLLGILALQKIISGQIQKQEIITALKRSIYVIGGIFLLFVILPGFSYAFGGQVDEQYLSEGGEHFINALRQDRESMYWSDTFRSIAFVALTFVLVYLFAKGNVKLPVLIGVMLVLVLADMWPVNKRFLNNDNFVAKKSTEIPYKPSKADEYILNDKDPDFRVLNLTVSTFNDASTSYFHKSIGGYHGAKMKRYQELIENNVTPDIMTITKTLQNKPTQTSLNVAFSKCKILNMLNTKYIIYSKDAPPLGNNYRFGNVWFVHEVKIANNADEEIKELNNVDIRTTAVVDKRFENILSGYTPAFDSTATIVLTEYTPKKLVYHSSSQTDQLAVFSEIYYNKGWNAYIEGELIPHFRANYVLRSAIIPAGERDIEFRFEPKAYFVGEKISLASSGLLLLLFAIAVFLEFKKSTEPEGEKKITHAEPNDL